MKRTSLLVFLIWLAVGTWAQQLTMKQSRDRALQYLKAKSPAKTRGLTSAQLKAAKVGADKIYAFICDGYDGDGLFHIILKSADVLITVSGDDTYITVYNPAEEVLELIGSLAGSEGLFIWR